MSFLKANISLAMSIICFESVRYTIGNKHSAFRWPAIELELLLISVNYLLCLYLSVYLSACGKFIFLVDLSNFSNKQNLVYIFSPDSKRIFDVSVSDESIGDSMLNKLHTERKNSPPPPHPRDQNRRNCPHPWHSRFLRHNVRYTYWTLWSVP